MSWKRSDLTSKSVLQLLTTGPVCVALLVHFVGADHRIRADKHVLYDDVFAKGLVRIGGFMDLRNIAAGVLSDNL